MDADFINSNFVNIEDLSSLSDKLNELENLSSQITQIAQEKYESAVDKIVSVVEMISESDLSEAIANVEALILEFGDIPMFVVLKENLESKKTVSDDVEKLTTGQIIQEKLKSELSHTELGIVARDIHEFKDICTNETVINSLFQQLEGEVYIRQQQLEPKLRQILQECHWLSKDEQSKVPDETLTQVANLVQELILIQNINDAPQYPDSWWAVDILLEPIVLRFNYHFNSSHKDTNKLSKPEWALNYIETFLTGHLPLLNLIVDDSFKQVSRIGTYEIITSLLKPVREKILRMINIINSNITKFQSDPGMLEKNGLLLSHLIFELSSFDQRLRNTYKYNPYIDKLDAPASESWTGITSDVLLSDGSNVAVENWLNLENELASKRFDTEIVNAKDAFMIDFDYQGNLEEEDNSNVHMYILKPTYSAYALVKLVNNLNSHFQTLNIVKYQLKYVSKIQMNLVEKYYETLNKNYKSFLDKFNLKSMLSYIPGGMKDPVEEQARSESLIRGLEKLTEIFCSAKFVVNALEQWEDELIFIQLWETYKGLTNDIEKDHTSVFSSSISQYDGLVTNLLNDYDEFFRTETKELLKNYVNKSQWVMDSNEDTNIASSLLSPLINNLPQYLDILRRSISSLDYFYITDRVVTILSTIIYEYVLTNNRFNRAGIDQLLEDFAYIIKQLHIHLFLNTEEYAEYSNDSNDKYIKLVQAIDLMDSLEPNQAKVFKSSSESLAQLRLNYAHELSGLTNHDLTDLLSRIV
ncbi:uncharacterized protein SPAPADRAFT_57035 [Spathaspora passalidarum NRRL Y-27907]|uniref:Uncharacterized protein n=1 Tax=Spathaspora passalidarum (strain NRRL Y-27907 / 11-Y1) TaxID=619300 RepID=G3ASS2_SPAPN|nr:uncharacterized protein SPAPADRAFT_57035 [Spathaspora passalidarum NRRL Y-27907]EGW31136.1 hypothetical protein SPAPADRAFT_57035 [Spathaspora passalidarum NRRL Y-27907]